MAASVPAAERGAAQDRLRWGLLSSLVRKDIAVKYQGSVLGFVWSLAHPLLRLGIYDVVFDNGIPDFHRLPDVGPAGVHGVQHGDDCGVDEHRRQRRAGEEGPLPAARAAVRGGRLRRGAARDAAARAARHRAGQRRAARPAAAAARPGARAARAVRHRPRRARCGGERALPRHQPLRRGRPAGVVLAHPGPERRLPGQGRAAGPGRLGVGRLLPQPDGHRRVDLPAILFVTHSVDLVSTLCTRGVVVDRGRVRYDGDPAFAVGTLRKLLGTDRPAGEPPAPEPSGGVVVHAATVSASPGGAAADRLAAGEPLHLRVECEVLRGGEVPPSEVAVVVMGAGDIPVFSLRTAPGQGLPAEPGRYAVDFAVTLPPLNGAFVVGVQVEHARSGLPITARRFDRAFWVSTGTLPGLLHVPATVRTRARTGTPA